MEFAFPAFEWIVQPVLFLLISIGCSFFLEPFLRFVPDNVPVLALGLRIAVICGFYLLFLMLYRFLPRQPFGRRKK